MSPKTIRIDSITNGQVTALAMHDDLGRFAALAGLTTDNDLLLSLLRARIPHVSFPPEVALLRAAIALVESRAGARKGDAP